MQDMDKQEANARLVLLSKPNARFFYQSKCMQDMDGKGANAKLILGTIFFPNQMRARFFHQTKCLQDMDGKGAT
jgi:hypothetical protein